MTNIENISEFLEAYAPVRLAESWDNVGLLVGDPKRGVLRAMTCLTITPGAVAEAIERSANLIITHHPMPFAALKRLTTATTVGRILMDLIAAEIAVYSPHTAFDSAAQGINQRLAEGVGLTRIEALVPRTDMPGAGRHGWIESRLSLAELSARLMRFLAIDQLQIVGPNDRMIDHVAVGCGAADEFLDAANALGCNAMILGEARFHTCLEAEALGIGLLLPGHFASERFAVESLAHVLSERFPDIEFWASRSECDPIRYLSGPMGRT